MAKTIWKFIVNPNHMNVEMPLGAKILSVHAQAGDICVWALVDPTIEDKEIRCLAVYGTGMELPDQPGLFIGTAHIPNAGLVLHVFETE